MLTDIRFNTYLVWVFIDLNKAQTNKMPYRDSPHHEIEILMSFSYLNLFRPHEHTGDYHIRKPSDNNLVFESEDKNIFMWEKIWLVLKQLIK